MIEEVIRIMSTPINQLPLIEQIVVFLIGIIIIFFVGVILFGLYGGSFRK